MEQQRRMVLTAGILASASWALTGCSSVQKFTGWGNETKTPKVDNWQQRLKLLEARSGGRLGLSVQVAGSERTLGYREDEAFPLCSTFKLLLAARILHLTQLGEFPLEQSLLYEKKQLVAHSPVTEKFADAEGMTVHDLCKAIIEVSDNTAANLLLTLQDGPAGLTRWLRTQGDMRTRLDRYETDLNSAIAGDARDTTTPRAMSRTALALLTERQGALAPQSQRMLREWLHDSRTGDKRLRAGMPGQWRIGGKTGSGDNGTANDVLLVQPGIGMPSMLVSAYLTGAMRLDAAGRDVLLADVGQVVADWAQSKG